MADDIVLYTYGEEKIDFDFPYHKVTIIKGYPPMSEDDDPTPPPDDPTPEPEPTTPTPEPEDPNEIDINPVWPEPDPENPNTDITIPTENDKITINTKYYATNGTLGDVYYVYTNQDKGESWARQESLKYINVETTTEYTLNHNNGGMLLIFLRDPYNHCYMYIKQKPYTTTFLSGSTVLYCPYYNDGDIINITLSFITNIKFCTISVTNDITNLKLQFTDSLWNRRVGAILFTSVGTTSINQPISTFYPYTFNMDDWITFDQTSVLFNVTGFQWITGNDYYHLGKEVEGIKDVTKYLPLNYGEIVRSSQGYDVATIINDGNI